MDEKISYPNSLWVDDDLSLVQELFREPDFYILRMAASHRRAWRGNRADVRRLGHLIIALAKMLKDVRYERAELDEILTSLAGTVCECDLPARHHVGTIRDHEGNRRWVNRSFIDVVSKAMLGEEKPNKVPRLVLVALRAATEVFNRACQEAYDLGFEHGTDVIKAMKDLNGDIWKIKGRNKE